MARKINISGMTPEQKKQVKTIIELGQQFGNDESMANYLMGQLMDVYMPKEDPQETRINELGSAYELTQDENIKNLLNEELYKRLGMDPQAEAEKQALLTQFQTEFPTDNEDAAQNALIMSQAQANPELVKQYLASSAPQPSPFQAPTLNPITSIKNFMKYMGGYETAEDKRKRFTDIASQYNLPTR